MCVHRSRSVRGELDCWLARTYIYEISLGENVTGVSLSSKLITDSDQAHRRTEALFRKEQQLREGRQAMAEYQAKLDAMRENTARLRALRLARDAADSVNTKLPPKKRTGTR